MEEVIKKIIEIEETAQKLMEDTEKEKEEKKKEHQARIQALEEKIMHDAKRKVVQLREREALENQKMTQEKIEMCDQHLIKMAKHMKKNKDQWVEELVEAVLKG